MQRNSSHPRLIALGHCHSPYTDPPGSEVEHVFHCTCTHVLCTDIAHNKTGLPLADFQPPASPVSGCRLVVSQAAGSQTCSSTCQLVWSEVKVIFLTTSVCVCLAHMPLSTVYRKTVKQLDFNQQIGQIGAQLNGRSGQMWPEVCPHATSPF